jgi:hypothetical protein
LCHWGFLPSGSFGKVFGKLLEEGGEGVRAATAARSWALSAA